QFRYAANKDLWELPAGKIDSDEPALVAAKRELLEETGYSAKRWKKFLEFYVSPGFLDEIMFVYLATGLSEGKAQPEADEFIETKFVPLSRAVKMIAREEIIDAKTAFSILWLDRNPESLKIR